MQLKRNWRDLLRYAWSIRLIVLSALLTGIEFVLPIFMDDPPFHRGLFAAFGFAVSVGAFFARLVAQKDISDD